ncbi:MAG: FMN-binding glutamate synthase family protein [Bacteroidota bacterium]
MFWPTLAACLTALALAGLLILLLARPLIDLIVDRLTKRIFAKPYDKNLLEMANVATKIGPMNLAEIELRAESGKPERRPFGGRWNRSRWDKFFFRSVYLSGQPLADPVEVDGKVTIGPAAAKPLQLEIPIMIGGMAWGNALSRRAKIALALGSALAGTATNTGSGPFLPAERAAAGKLVLQVSRGAWMRDPAILRQGDMIEISLGHGATGSSRNEIKESVLEKDPEFRAALGGADPVVGSTLPEGWGLIPLQELVASIRALTHGVPVGVKFGATDRLEDELALILQAKPDFVTIDGNEGGSHGIGTAVHDSNGLPTLHAVCRADRFLRMRGVRGQMSLIIGGGLYQPADFLKAMALGADAVIIGTSALLAIVHAQVEKVTPFQPPTQLVWHGGKKAGSLNPDKGALYLARFLESCVAEMNQVAQVLGRARLRDITRADLCCLDRDLATLAGVRWAGDPPAPEGDGEWRS